MVDNRTGATVVMASGLDFGTDLGAGQRQYDLATKGRRNPGSAFKPFGLIAALEKGIVLNSHWDYSTPQVLDFGGIEPWECANAGNNPPGVRTLEAALYLSTNTVFCQVAIAVGAEQIVDVAHRMGIRSPLAEVPAIVLGAAAVSPLEMATGYSTIANQGLHVHNYLIERIEDSEGNVIYQHQVQSEQVLEPALAASVINTMEKVITQGTGGAAYIGRPQIGKTGTHEGNSDAWYVGSVPQYSTAVWVGYPDAQLEMRNLTIKGRFIPRMFGSSAPAPIWQEFMTYVVRDLPVENFPEDPAGIAVYYTLPRVTIPDVVGLHINEARKQLLEAGLAVEVITVNSDLPENRVVATNPPPGARVSQGTTIEVEVSNAQSPTTVLPDVTGMKRGVADDTLRTHRNQTGIAFSWEFVEVETSVAEDANVVIDTNPSPGSSINEQTVVRVTVWKYVEGG
jgi:membrane peptidoglycan carboxypeptidase